MSVDLVIEDARWKTLDLPQIANTAFKETLSQLNMKSENFICCILACSSKKIKGLNVQFRGKNRFRRGARAEKDHGNGEGKDAGHDANLTRLSRASSLSCRNSV